MQNEIFEFVKLEIERKRVKCILLSDYQKGMLTITLCQQIISLCNENEIHVYVDPKVKEIEKYKHAFLIKPNRKEANGILQTLHLSSDHEIIKYLDISLMIITLGSEGMILYEKNKKPILIKNQNQNIIVKDVTGCGDSVFASFVYIYETFQEKEEIKMKYAIEFANFVGNRAVGNMGTYISSHQDWIDFHQYQENESFKTFDFHIDQDKMIDWILKIKDKHSKIIFTNGCFDVIHTGHLKLLHYAKKCGNFLIIGLNADHSIKKLKGPLRPIHAQEERILFLKELGIADSIILFHEDTPEKLLSVIQPDMIIKGGDYTPDSILGKEYCKEVRIFDFVDGYSSTKMIQHITKKSSRTTPYHKTE